LPAEPTGESQLLGESELKPLADTYPPTVLPALPADQENAGLRVQAEAIPLGRPYRKPVPIQPPKTRPVFVAGLRARPGAATIPLGEGSPHLLAVEGRVGRGRITMLTINPTDPALVSWPGIDTLIRRVILRRPEEGGVSLQASYDPGAIFSPSRAMLEGPDLSWYRITSRDTGAEGEAARARAAQASRPSPPGNRFGPQAVTMPPAQGSLTAEAEEAALNRTGVAEWRDTTTLPRVCRDLLEKAAGITVPSSQFVLKVILAYILAVVPLNWLICRLLLKRREWAWIVVPLLALGFAVGVERVAAYDMGYDSACDEIDLLEIQGGYPRAHLTRFASIYTTGRGKYSISYPNDPTAVALPFSTERSIGGEDIVTSMWQSYPVPALQGFTVQPRSLSMFRAEQMLGLSGSITMEETKGGRSIVNGTDLELHDAVLVDFPDPKQRHEPYLGTIAPLASVSLASRAPASAAERVEGHDGPDPAPLLAELRKSWDNRPENSGELRLVAWVPRPAGGQTFEPALDRHRGMTAVLVHVRYGNPPSPATSRYNLLAGSGWTKRAAPDGYLADRSN